MSLGAFNHSLKQSYSFLNNIELFKSKGIKIINKDGVSREFKNASQKDDYFTLYKCAINNFDYDILLNDDSIFQFSYTFNAGDLPDIRYAYFQNPQEYKSYEDFLESLRELRIVENETNEEIGNSFENEYQQFLTEQNVNTSSVSIRYDLDPANHIPLVHSISHLHIGHQNNIRLPCERILTPFKFVIFVLKHVYYYKWKELIEEENSHLQHSLNSAKAGCIVLKEPHWQQKETQELFLS